MKLYKIMIFSLFSFLPALVHAQGMPAYLTGEMTMLEKPIEADKVVLSYSESSGLVEVRVLRCAQCSYESYLVSDSVSISLGDALMAQEIAAKRLSGAAATVFIEPSSNKVTRVRFFASGGEVEQ